MKKVGLFIATAVMLVLFAFSASAETEGYYTYEVENGEATIIEINKSFSGKVTIPSTLGGYSVTSIGDSVFYYEDRLTSVTIPDSVTSIGNYAFYGCTKLTSVTIPDSVTSIGAEAFKDCTNLKSIYIPDSVSSIGENAFKNTNFYNNSSNWKNGILYIGNHLIGAQYTITSCKIREGTKTIGGWAFFSCFYLTEVTFPKSVETIGFGAFIDCSRLKSIRIGDGIKTIKASAFVGCWNLTDITIPDSVTYIGSSAFAETGYWSNSANWTNGGLYIGKHLLEVSDSVSSFNIKKGTKTIAESAFGSCKSLESVTIPDSIISLGGKAFYGCTNLTNVTIPDSVTSIGYEAFYGCSSLTSITIPDSVTSIGNSAFNSCPIKDVYYTGTKSQWNAITIGSGNSKLTNATIHYPHKNIVDIPQQNPTCTKVGYTAGKQCSHCEVWISGHETIAKLAHNYSSTFTTDKKATLSSNGSRSKHCTRDGCTAKTSVTAIAKISSVTLSKTNYVYDGKNKTPTVTINDANGNKLVKNTDYKLSVASKRSGIGRYTVKVTFIGNYSGTKNVYFYIKTGKPATVKSASQTTSSVKLTWSAVKGASGYTVYRYSPSKKAYVKAGTTEGTSLTVKKLYAGTKYTFRVVSYGKTSGGKVYDSDSYALLKTATKTKTPILSDYAVYKGKVQLFWTATSGETGYTIYYSTKKDSGFKKYANYESNSGYVKNLTSGKTYYFKVRTYIKTDSGYVYSDWSNIKGVKVK